MREVILLDPDPEGRMLLRALLERDGFSVAEAQDTRQAQDVIRASRADALLCGPGSVASEPHAPEQLGLLRPGMDVLTPRSYGGALLDGAAEGEGLSEFARDALLLLAILAEEGARRPVGAERLGRMTELTAFKLELSRRQAEACGSAAALVALGPSLVAFKFGIDPDAAAETAEGGLGRELQASLAAFGALRCPYDLRPVLEAVEERFDGRGRPRGLAGKRIPIAARVIAVAREFTDLVAGGAEPMAAAEVIRAGAGTAYDPKVVDAFFRALRDESYLERLEGGKRGARILLADGDAGALAVTEMRLSGAGFLVTAVEDGARAFELIERDKPDIVVADTALPKLDGISLLLKLRRSPELKEIPVFFIPSKTDAGTITKALKLGAKDVLAKPVNYDVLLAKLRSVSSAKQAEARKGGGVQGDLAEMPLADFFRVLALGRKTCKVAIESPQGQGQVFFEHGTPVAAYTREERGREAFAEVVTWSAGTFALTAGEVAPDHNLERGLEALLLQGTWQESSVGHDEDDTGPGVMFTPPAGA